MNFRLSPSSLAYSCFLTLSSASPRCFTMWNLSKRIAAWGALLFVDFPHVHDCQADSLAALFPQKCEERIHTFLRAVFAPKPDRAPPLQIAHYDSVGLAFPDRDLINANDLRLRLTGAPDLFAHILHLECPDGLPIEKVFLGHIPDRG